MAVGVIAKVILPFGKVSVASHELAQTETEIADYRRSNTDLERQLAYLHTPEGQVAQARANGYLRPGEVPLVIGGVTLPPATQTAPAEPLPSARPSPLEHARRWLRGFTGWTRGPHPL